MSAVLRLDILFVADVRFEGGASTALAAEVDAAAAAGFRCGLLMVKGALLGLTMPVHPLIRAAIDRGDLLPVDPEEPVAAPLSIVHHPTIFRNPPVRRPAVQSDRVVLVLHHPRLDQLGDEQYDLAEIVRNCRLAFGVDVLLAPVSRVVRETLALVPPQGSALLAEDWPNIIDCAAWQTRPERDPVWPVTLGRHARPDPLKWPEDLQEALLAYPDDPGRYRVRILGGGAFLDDLYGPLPRTWEVLPFRDEGVDTFLAGLDFYVYYHGPVWLEAFGRTILEAICARVPVILPPAFEPLFGPAAIYCEIDAVRQTIARFVADPAAYHAHVAAAHAHAVAHFDLRHFAPRLKRLFGLEPARAAAPARPPLPEARVLFLSTNGIGLGHLTQQMAIARRLPPDIRSIFGTMSLALQIPIEAGYEAHFLPHHHVLKIDAESWNAMFAEELFDLIAFTRPRLIAFDGTMPFPGLMRALRCFPQIPSLWVRRPLWREIHRPALAAADGFTLLVEPAELAQDFDHGPTAAEREQTLVVPPILHFAPDERLSRTSAREALGVAADDVVVAMQLGSGTNFELDATRRALIEAVLRHPSALVIEFVSPIADPRENAPLDHPRYRQRIHFPVFPLSAGFDWQIIAAGYNAFHEAILGGVPTLFVPNEAPEMDLQATRGHWAALNGMGRMLRRDHDRFAVREAVEEMMRSQVRDAIRAACASLPQDDGAGRLARVVAEHARMLRADIDPTRDFDTRP